MTRLRVFALALVFALSVSLSAQITNVLNPASDLSGKTLVTAEGNRTISGTFTWTVPALFVSGVAASPGIATGSDTTTGWRLAPSVIGGSLAGVQRFLLDASGLTIFGTNIINTAGKIPAISSTYFTSTAIDAALITSGTIATARLGSGTANATTFLRGDSTWVTPTTKGCDVRLSLTTAVPVTITDVTAATSVFAVPYSGIGGPATCSFFNGTTWDSVPVVEVTIAVPATTSTMYDVFCTNTAGAMACDSAVAWTNDTTRATALVVQDGVYVKAANFSRRYIGSFRTTTVSGQTEDSVLKRYVWNYYNRVDRLVRVIDATNSWTYTTDTYRCANTAGACVNQVDLIIGVAEVVLSLRVQGYATNNTSNIIAAVSIGEDSTTTPATEILGQASWLGTAANVISPMIASLDKYPAVGRHFYAWLERSTASNTTTWYGDNGDATKWQSGLSGRYKG